MFLRTLLLCNNLPTKFAGQRGTAGMGSGDSSAEYPLSPASAAATTITNANPGESGSPRPPPGTGRRLARAH